MFTKIIKGICDAWRWYVSLHPDNLTDQERLDTGCEWGEL